MGFKIGKIFKALTSGFLGGGSSSGESDRLIAAERAAVEQDRQRIMADRAEIDQRKQREKTKLEAARIRSIRGRSRRPGFLQDSGEGSVSGSEQRGTLG